MIKTTTNDVIESTKMLVCFSSDKSKIIDGITKTHQITPEFINEFSEFITKEIFTLSYKLTLNMVEMYPDLFSEELFRENLERLISSNLIGIDMLSRNIQDVKVIMAKRDNESSYDDESGVSEFEQYIINILRHSKKEEFTTDIVTSLVGVFSDRVISFLLKRTNDDELKQTIVSLIAISDETQLTPAVMKYIDNDTREEILGTEDVDPEDFINTISESKDYGWIRKLLNKVKNNEILLNTKKKDFSSTVIYAVMNLPEDLLVDVLKLRVYMPFAINNKLMQWILENKDLSESSLIFLIDEFKKTGNYFQLKKYAVENDYTDLLDALSKK